MNVSVEPVLRPRRPAGALIDRRAEREVLQGLVDAVGTGESRALVLTGEPGVGKSALLGYLVDAAAGLRITRVAGVLSESDLAFAGVHQLCSPFAEEVRALPARQLRALWGALGVGDGAPSDPFVVALAVLAVLSAAAARRPLLCVVDDGQWLDDDSARTLGFVARRLGAERRAGPVGLVLATRHRGDHLVGVPVLPVDGLPESEARTLLDVGFPAPLDADARDVIVAETHGNPSALLDLPTPIELAGGFRLPDATAGTPGIEEGLRRRLTALPSPALRLLELAAADPSGDPARVRRAAERLGIPHQATGAATGSGLVQFGVRVRFRHPLARSVTYRSASSHHRRRAHAALAAVTDPAAEADRRAWHRAHAVVAPDDVVAADLERAADRARERGGLPAAAAFLERAVALTADPARHADRVLAAVRTNLRAGAFGPATELLAAVSCGGATGARLDLARGQLEFAVHLGREAPSGLLAAARALEPVDLELARRTYVEAWVAATTAGRAADADPLEVALAARSLPTSGSAPAGAERLLSGLGLLSTEGSAAAAPVLREALAAVADADPGDDDGLRWARVAATALWDVGAARAITGRRVRAARADGALGVLPVELTALAIDEAGRGDLAGAAALVDEVDTIVELTGSRIAPYAALYLAALRGDPEELTPLVGFATDAAVAGQGAAHTCARWAAAILHNGHGRYAEAFADAEGAVADAHVAFSRWALPELVEAAVRTGQAKAADEGLAQLAETTRAGGSGFGLGLEARSRALRSEGAVAENAYRDAIDHLDGGEVHPGLARSHLLYGEWLRRESRRVDARRHLRTAYEMLRTVGMSAFAERARRELLATGESVRRRDHETGSALTSQEAAIARLAAEGRTNAEIGAQLFLSARTIEWHLRKVFTKLGIGSRRELRSGWPVNADAR